MTTAAGATGGDGRGSPDPAWRRDPDRDLRREGADYWLEWRESPDGDSRGYLVVRAEDGRRLQWPELAEATPIRGFDLAGQSFHAEELQDDAFAPGRPLSLVPRPSGSHGPSTVAVRSADGERQAGYLPSDRSGPVYRALRSGRDLRCLAGWEVRREGKRLGLRVLVARPEVDVALDRPAASGDTEL